MREFTGVIWRIATSQIVLWFWGKICSSKGMDSSNYLAENTYNLYLTCTLFLFDSVPLKPTIVAFICRQFLTKVFHFDTDVY